MSSIVFDAGPVISLTLNNMVGILEAMRKHLNGEFYIAPAVYNELVKRPLATVKYKFEALQILPLIMNGTIRIFQSEGLQEKTQRLINLANNSFYARGHAIEIVHRGEMETLAAAIILGSETCSIDERTTRVLIENPHSLREHLQKKLHTHVEYNRDNIDLLHKEIGHLKVIRSFEIALVAFELGLFDRYLLKEEEKLAEIDDIRKSVLEGVLWAIKLSGCSVAREEIEEALAIESVIS